MSLYVTYNQRHELPMYPHIECICKVLEVNKEYENGEPIEYPFKVLNLTLGGIKYLRSNQIKSKFVK